MTISDARHKSHMVGLVVTNTWEKKEDFEFVFRSLQETIDALMGQGYNPESIVGDGTLAIDAAMEIVWPNVGTRPMRIMCWKHMLDAVTRKMTEFGIGKKRINDFIEDLKFVQPLCNTRLFDNGLNLLMEKHQ